MLLELDRVALPVKVAPLRRRTRALAVSRLRSPAMVAPSRMPPLLEKVRAAGAMVPLRIVPPWRVMTPRAASTVRVAAVLVIVPVMLITPPVRVIVPRSAVVKVPPRFSVEVVMSMVPPALVQSPARLIVPLVPVMVPRLVTVLVFFQAEDGIRDDLVTGVQTCALPI